MQKISGYTPEAAAKMLKTYDSHPVKGNWKKHRKIEELEPYQCEITWLSKSRAVDLAGDVISPLTLRSVVLFRKLQSFNGRSVQSLPPSVKSTFLWKTLTASRNWSLTLNTLSQVDLF